MNDEDLRKIKQAVKIVVKDEVSASERRLEERLTKNLTGTEKRMYVEIGQFIEESILTELAEKAEKSDLKDLSTKNDIDRIERKLDKALDMGIENKQKINEIASIPSIAHQLKVKK